VTTFTDKSSLTEPGINSDVKKGQIWLAPQFFPTKEKGHALIF
jgi:hypothetical protein